MIRDTLERLQLAVTGTTATAAGDESQVKLRQEIADVVALLEDVRGELQVLNRGAGRSIEHLTKVEGQKLQFAGRLAPISTSGSTCVSLQLLRL